MPTQYGHFLDFCRDTGNTRSTLPVCNLFYGALSRDNTGFDNGCELLGIHLKGDNYLANLGSILICGLAIVVAAFLFWRSERKRAAVGRREIQLFLLGYILISICEIFTSGQFPLKGKVRIAFSAVHIAAVTATTWVLMLNGIVGYQLLDDGTPLSIGLIAFSTALLFVGTGYIALDTGYSWTGHWDKVGIQDPGVISNALYTLYFLAPLVFLAIFFLLESYLVLRILGERKPMLYLLGAVLLFAIGQIFQFVISVHICGSTNGKLNGGLFETLFTLLAVAMIWIFWSSITEDDWPMPTTGGTYT